MARKRKLEASPVADRAELRSLIDAAKADRRDDGPRFALADWLEENGGEADRARAEVIRLQLDTSAGGPDWSLTVERLREKWVREWVSPHRELFRTKLPDCERGLLVAEVRSNIWGRRAMPPDEAWAWVETARPLSIKTPELRDMMASRLMATVTRFDLLPQALGVGGVRALLAHLAPGVRSLRFTTHVADLGVVAKALRPGLDVLHVQADANRPPSWAPLLSSPGVAGLHGLSLGRSFLDDAGAAALATQDGLRGLGRLGLEHARLTGVGLAALAGLPLRRLTIQPGQFGLAGLARLAAGACRDTLEDLRIDGLVREPPERLPALPRLRRLALTRGGVNAQGVAALVAGGLLAGLTELDLSGNLIGAEGVSALADCGAGPRALRLASCGLDAEGVARLAAWPGLARVRYLDLGGNGLASEAVRALAGSPHLGALDGLSLAGNTRVTPADLESLLKSPFAARLRWLAVDSPAPVLGAVEAFERSPPPHLRELRLRLSAVHHVAGGPARLRAVLPGCAIG